MSTLNHTPDSPKRLIAHAAATRHGVLDEPLVLSRTECEDIVARALKLSTADACRVSVSSSYETNLRFADPEATDDELDRPCQVVEYRVGELCVFDSYRLHQIQPFGGRRDRISVTAHAAEVEPGLWEVWF